MEPMTHQHSTIDLCFIRHGGGADFGKTHVFNVSGSRFGVHISMQCVTDDFGDLVEVK